MYGAVYRNYSVVAAGVMWFVVVCHIYDSDDSRLCIQHTLFGKGDSQLARGALLHLLWIRI